MLQVMSFGSINMASIPSLKEQGWYFTEEGFNQISENGKITDQKAIIKKALDTDIREICGGGFPSDLTKGKLDNLPGNVVVQILKIRNVSAPKANEESKHSPRMLRLVLSDGQIAFSGLENEHISSLSLDTPPGTKIFLKSGPIKISHNLFILDPSNVTVLGGKVPALVEKWELNRSLAKYAKGRRISAEGGPPPWIPFGQKISSGIPVDKNFKSLDSTKEKENQRNNSEFEAQRQDAIAEAAKLGQKKIFGGGSKHIVDANVQKIVDHGFTEQQAEYALKLTRNNVDRALKNLQRREENGRSINPRGEQSQKATASGAGAKGSRNEQSKNETNKFETKSVREEWDNKTDKRKGRNKDDDETNTKPTGKISLFDFLEDKLPVEPEKPASTEPLKKTNDHKFRNENGKYHNENGRYQNDRDYGRNSNRGNTKGGYSNNSRDGYSNNSYRDNRNEGNTRENHFQPQDNNYRESNTNSGSTKEKYPNNKLHDKRDKYYEDKNSEKPPRFQKNHNRISYEATGPYQQSKSNHYGNYQNKNNDKPAANNKNDQNDNSPMDDIANQTSNLSISKNVASNRNNSGNHKQYNKDNNSYYKQKSNASNNYNVQNNTHSLSFPSNEYNNYQYPPVNSKSEVKASYKSDKIMGFQNKLTNEHALSMMRNSEPPADAQPIVKEASVDSGWKWSVGDRCLAKYWEDNRYYNAEVTAVSEKTCVVRFPEYGNYEEILQNDCLPVTEDNDGKPLSKQFQNKTNIVTKRPPAPFSKKSHQEGGYRNKSIRVAQSVYVPPAQRNQTSQPK